MPATAKKQVERVTVRSLISVLQALPPEAAIAVSSDPEGNCVSYLHNLSVEGEVVVFWPMGYGGEVGL
jgi:hypothetical protein